MVIITLFYTLTPSLTKNMSILSCFHPRNSLQPAVLHLWLVVQCGLQHRGRFLQSQRWCRGCPDWGWKIASQSLIVLSNRAKLINSNNNKSFIKNGGPNYKMSKLFSEFPEINVENNLKGNKTILWIRYLGYNKKWNNL